MLNRIEVDIVVETTDKNFNNLFIQSNKLLLAKEKCKYLFGDNGSKLVISGIIDLISRYQSEIEEVIDSPEFDSKYLDFFTEKTYETVKLLAEQAPLVESAEQIAIRKQFEEFTNQLIDNDTYKYLRTVLPNRKNVTRYNANGDPTMTFYVKNDDYGKEVRDGPIVIFSDGEIKEIGYMRDGRPVGTWFKFAPDGSVHPLILKDPKWFYGDPKQLLDLYESYQSKYNVVSPTEIPIDINESLEENTDEDEGLGLGTAIFGSLAAVALTSIFSKRASTKTIKEKTKQRQIVQEK